MAREQEERNEAALKQRAADYRQDLQTQLSDNVQRKQEEYERFLHEKSLVDDIVRQIMAEDAAYAKSMCIYI